MRSVACLGCQLYVVPVEEKKENKRWCNCLSLLVLIDLTDKSGISFTNGSTNEVPQIAVSYF